MPAAATVNEHPIALLLRDAEKLAAWIRGDTDLAPTCAVGAIGEILTASQLGGTIESHTTHGHDVDADGTRVEVRTRTTGGPVGSLASKACERIVRVDLERKPAAAGRNPGLVVTSMLSRPHPAQGSDGGWTPVAGQWPLKLV